MGVAWRDGAPLERVQWPYGRGVAYLQLLGRARIQLGATAIPFAPNKRYQLLCYLAYHGDWLSRDKLAFLFWPDESNHTARHNLRQLLKHLRKLPWLTGLEANEQGLRWQVTTDVEALNEGSVDKALSLYRGPLLAEMEGVAGGEFGNWLESEREHLHSRWRETLLGRAAELEEEQADKAIQVLRCLLERDELDEEALQAHLRLALKMGRREQGLKRYRAFAKRLHEELDLEPTSTTQGLAQVLEGAKESAASGALGPLPRPAPLQPAAPSTVTVKTAAPSLPTHATSFIGRDLELAEVVHLLSRADCRLLSLTGAGGVGKTRMALQAASELTRNYQDGVFFVPLESLTSASLIPAGIASALGSELPGQEEPLVQLIGSLKNRRTLLVLDNYEHLLEGATVASELLQSCPKLKLLITSRERLNLEEEWLLLEEEWLLPVEGLSYPGLEVTLEQISACDAVQLFLQRAQRVRPSFSLGEEALPHVLKICQLVDGSPLDLELAAVWVRAMPVAEIAKELEGNVDLLSTSSRNVKERHRSIRAAFEYSWGLLSPVEQEVLRKLSAFRGGFTREAAAVVAGALAVVLAALVDKSLLRVSASGRYDRHPLLYHYTQEKLSAHPEEKREAREKHTGYFLALAEEAEPHLKGARQASWLKRLESEHDNFRAVLERAGQSGEAETGLRLAGVLSQFWWLHSHLSEGRKRLAGMLAQTKNKRTAARAKALDGAGTLALYQGDLALARSLHEESLAIRRELRDKRGVADSLDNLGSVAFHQGDYPAARSLHGKSLKLRQTLGGKRGIAISLNNLGTVAEDEGDYLSARSLYEKSLALVKELKEDHLLAVLLSNLGEVALKQEDVISARSFLEEGLATSRELGNKYHIAWSLNLLGLLAFLQDDEASAHAHYQESLSIRQGLGDACGIAVSLQNLGNLACKQGDYALAGSLLKESLGIFHELEHKPNLAYSLESMASLAAATGHLEQSVQFWGATEALREAIGAPLAPHHRPRYERTVTAARAQLGEAAFMAGWAEGKKLGLEQAIPFALETTLGKERR